ncbi:Transcriptional regulator [Carbonactinospora thermoautotrophica]|uniref:Transcriptional regulator n=1 Tax=Carbonactinospora thermoautotrophica TaxID=1469144 RepID=A0A132MPD3_9ACTN|nr:helix-turn-helix transcriptional regulator [Carbonactinospora thermoautotrophica]KWW99579.1 Transcriptional regulator [Carbonactinospora thermoautotrophica]
MTTADELAGKPCGERIKFFREQIGMSRPVLGGLVGRSAEWVKAVETGRLQTPRLPMLLRIAHALGIEDLAVLTGNSHAVPVRVFAGTAHAALAAVRAALTDYQLSSTAAPPRLPHLQARLDQAWAIRHASPDHRTQVGALLPDLIRDAHRAIAAYEGEERREARRLLAGVYHLADMYVAYQPAPELVWLVADRAMTQAREADDPLAIGGSAWALVSALRDSGRWAEAVSVAHDAAKLLEPYLPDAPDDWLAMWGALQFEVAYTLARRGRHGDAWHYWDRADQAARRLPADYRHTQTSFGQAVMHAHAVTLGVELRRPGEALRAADRLDPDDIASVPRRSRHLIEVARAHYQRDERLATLLLLDKAERTAPETVRYNGFARDMILNLLAQPPTAARAEVRALAARVGFAA